MGRGDDAGVTAAVVPAERTAVTSPTAAQSFADRAARQAHALVNARREQDTRAHRALRPGICAASRVANRMAIARPPVLSNRGGRAGHAFESATAS